MAELKTINFTPPLNVTYVQDGAGLLKIVKFINHSKDRVIGWDKETTCVKDFFTRRDRTWQIGDMHEQFVVDLLSFVDGDSECLRNCQGAYGKGLDRRLLPVRDLFSKFLCTGKVLKVGVNLAFEYEQSYWNFGQRTYNFFSCDMVERLIQAGAHSLKDYDYYSMDQMIGRYFGAKVDKTLQTSFNLTDPLTKEQIEYAAIDTRLPLVLRKAQLLVIQQAGLEEVAKIENDAIGAFVDMHVHGLRMDEDKWNGMEAINRSEFDKIIYEELDPFFLPIVGSKLDVVSEEQVETAKAAWKALDIKTQREERDRLKKIASDLGKLRTKQKNLSAKCEGDALINYASGAQVLHIIENMPELKGLDSTDDGELEKFKDVPVIAAFRKYRGLSKKLKTYGKTWTSTWVTGPGAKHDKIQEGWLHPGDRRIHSHFNQLDAGTGRSTSSGPNDQNIPHDPETRACFIADPPDADEPEGYVIVTSDMAGAELRILAELSGEKAWINAFNRGEDVHEVCAELMYQDEWPGWAAPGCAYYKPRPDGTPQHEKCKCPNHKDKRDEAKVPNFLIPYGGQASNLAAQTGKTEEEAQAILDKHKATFPILWAYLEESGKAAQANRAAWSMFGRRRQFPEPTWDHAIAAILEEAQEEEGCRWEKYMRKEPRVFGFTATKWTDAMWEDAVERVTAQQLESHGKKPVKAELYALMHRDMPLPWQISSMIKSLFSRMERQGKNHPIQATNADIIKLAMGCGYSPKGLPYLWHTLQLMKAKVLAMVHDELLIQCPVRFANRVAKAVGIAFAAAAAEKMNKVRMEFAFQVAQHWQK